MVQGNNKTARMMMKEWTIMEKKKMRMRTPEEA
jgi:hypothetical protein